MAMAVPVTAATVMPSPPWHDAYTMLVWACKVTTRSVGHLHMTHPAYLLSLKASTGLRTFAFMDGRLHVGTSASTPGVMPSVVSSPVATVDIAASKFA